MVRYTLGIWHISHGRAQDFIDGWTELAEWTLREVPGSRFAKLLRDTDDDHRFISFGPWDDAGSVEAWQALPGFQERIGRLRSLTESFEPRNLSVEREIG